MPNSKQTKVALVTGSGRRRVGNVVAHSLAEQGNAIALHYHTSAEAAADSADDIKSRGVECETFKANVADDDDVKKMFTAVVDRFGRLDVLVTTASIWETKALEKVTADDLHRNFSVNTLGTFLCAQQAGLIMTGQTEGGVIITIGDWAIERPYLDHCAYFVSKGAMPTLTRTLAVELAHRNPKVRVNCIHPGPVMFPPGTTPQEQQAMVDSTLVKTANCPDSIAQAVKFFVENPFVTGTCLPVDGGRTIYATESTGRDRPI